MPDLCKVPYTWQKIVEWGVRCAPRHSPTNPPTILRPFRRSIRYVPLARRKDVRLSYFTPSQFETIVGPIREMFSQLVKGRPSLLKKAKSQRHVHQKLRRNCRAAAVETGLDELYT